MSENDEKRLVVCCKACGGCHHGTPHERETHEGEYCTQWGDCHHPDGRVIRVRCVVDATHDGLTN